MVISFPCFGDIPMPVPSEILRKKIGSIMVCHAPLITMLNRILIFGIIIRLLLHRSILMPIRSILIPIREWNAIIIIGNFHVPFLLLFLMKYIFMLQFILI